MSSVMRSLIESCFDRAEVKVNKRLYDVTFFWDDCGCLRLSTVVDIKTDHVMNPGGWWIATTKETEILRRIYKKLKLKLYPKRKK